MPELTVVLFTTRNKDNKDRVKDFKEHSESFVLDKNTQQSYVQRRWKNFLSNRKPGEVARFYESINTRDAHETQKKLIIAMVEEDLDLTKIEAKIASLAMKSRSKQSNKWMFDFDSEDKFRQESFLKDLENELQAHLDKYKISSYETPNGIHFVVDFLDKRGFDTRKILADYPEVELHRDGFSLVDCITV